VGSDAATLRLTWDRHSRPRKCFQHCSGFLPWHFAKGTRAASIALAIHFGHREAHFGRTDGITIGSRPLNEARAQKKIVVY